MMKTIWAVLIFIFVKIYFHCPVKNNFPLSSDDGFVKYSKNPQGFLNASHSEINTQKCCLNSNINKSGETIFLERAATVNSTKALRLANNSTCKYNLLPIGSLNIEHQGEYHGKATKRPLGKISADNLKREVINYNLSSLHFKEVIDSFVTATKQVSNKSRFPEVNYLNNEMQIKIRDGWFMGVESLKWSSPLVTHKETTYIISFEAQFGVVKFGYRRVDIQYNSLKAHLHITFSSKNVKMVISLIVSVVTEGKCHINPWKVSVTDLRYVGVRIDCPPYLRWLLPSLQSSFSQFSDGLVKNTISKYVLMSMQDASNNFSCKVAGLY